MGRYESKTGTTGGPGGLTRYATGRFQGIQGEITECNIDLLLT